MDAPNLWLVGGVLGLAGLNLWVADNFHGHVGNLKVFGLMGLQLAFVVLTVVYLAVTGALAEGSLEKSEPQDS